MAQSRIPARHVGYITLVACLAVAGLPAVATSSSATAPLSPETGARVATTGSPVSTGTGVVYFVDAVAGDDSDTGLSAAHAWKTLARVGASAFAPGDVIAFERGQTFTGSATIDDAGTASSPITVTAFGAGAQPVLTNPGQWNMLVLDAPYLQVKNLAFDDGAVFDNADGEGIRGPKYEMSGAVVVTGAATDALVQDNTFTDVGVGVKTYGTGTSVDHNTFQNLRIAFRGMDSGSETSYGALGVSIDNSHVAVTYNDFINCRSTDSPYGADGGAIEIEGFDHAKDDIAISHNYSRGSQGFLEVTETTSSGVTISENVSDDYQQFIAWDTTTDPDGYLAVNNTVVRSSDSSRLFDQYYYREAGPSPDASWVTIRNNIFVASAWLSFYDFPRDHNLYGSGVGVGSSSGHTFALGLGDLVGSPGFTDLAEHDLSLTAVSAAVDNGAAPVEPTDLLGNPTDVGLGPDMGAIERQIVAPAGPNIVSDGGFESQTSIGTSTTPWYREGSLSTGVDLAAGTAHGGSDNGWVANSSGSSWGAVKQNISVSTGSTYRMTAWIQDSGNVNGAWVGAKTTGGTVLGEANLGTTGSGYQRYVVTFTTGSNTTVVLHAGYWAPGAAAWLRVDDVTLQKLS